MSVRFLCCGHRITKTKTKKSAHKSHTHTHTHTHIIHTVSILRQEGRAPSAVGDTKNKSNTSIVCFALLCFALNLVYFSLSSEQAIRNRMTSSPPLDSPKSPPRRLPSSPQSNYYYHSPQNGQAQQQQEIYWVSPFMQEQRRRGRHQQQQQQRKHQLFHQHFNLEQQDLQQPSFMTDICITFARKLLLEVLGGAGAVWGSSEVIELRTDATDWFWRPVAILVGCIMLLRWCCELTTACQAWYLASQMASSGASDNNDETFIWPSQDEESLALVESGCNITEATSLYSSTTGTSFSSSIDVGYETL